MINEEYGFEYEQETPWHAVFAEAPPASPRPGSATAPVTFRTLADFLAHAPLPESDDEDSSFKCALSSTLTRSPVAPRHSKTPFASPDHLRHPSAQS